MLAVFGQPNVHFAEACVAYLLFLGPASATVERVMSVNGPGCQYEQTVIRQRYFTNIIFEWRGYLALFVPAVPI